MEIRYRKHPLNMFNLLIPFLFFVLTGFGQSTDSMRINIFNECEKNFSVVRLDSTFCNFYIKDFKDTIYFRHSSCILQAQTTSPLTFKLRIQNGYAHGFLRIYAQNDSSYTWIDGDFSNGFIVHGSHLEYYPNGTLKLTGQYEDGHQNGVWTWYFEDGKINRIVIYKIAEPVKIMEYDTEGNLIDEYDFVKEKTNANMH
jgi:hypothetical protein